MTRRDERLAGVIALLTGLLLSASLVLRGSGPSSAQPEAVLGWYARNAEIVRAGSLVWLAAMLGFVVFAVLLRDALLALTAGRWWAGVLFVQGAAVFATVVVIAAATGWATTALATGPDPHPETVAALWTLNGTLLRFATWGLAVPLVTVGLTLARHSTMGKVTAVVGLAVAVTLLVPATWAYGLPAFAGWVLLTSLTLLVPRNQATRLVAPGVSSESSQVTDTDERDS